uniref:Uncharacterized protein n=1 Tax=Tetraselmis chuii TaxID=63592 RepID=A0A7S1X9Y1_9CHLO|mmetsp:Transcript_6453/g.11638  ORF Transcript_6453/g.11638 Transcript_6453/m.11638 type:complete len:443 (+) Transcript_6453:898-2226(+)
MRRCSSDPQFEFEAARDQYQSFAVCPRTSAKARWKWAFQMTKKFCKGVSSNDGFVMLLPEHWLEARHPEHRSHLKPYFNHWLQSGTGEGFFHWLDYGEGKDLDLPERPRAQLEACRVRYCGPELALLEVCVEEGLLKYRIGKRLVHTPLESEPSTYSQTLNTATSGVPGEARPKSKWIYVLDVHNRFYINKKQAGEFHHSSFTRGGPVRAAGSIIVDDGRVRQITAWSGHYRPTEQDFDEVIAYLGSRGVDMSQVEKFLTKMKAGSKMAVPPAARELPIGELRRVSCPSTAEVPDRTTEEEREPKAIDPRLSKLQLQLQTGEGDPEERFLHGILSPLRPQRTVSFSHATRPESSEPSIAYSPSTTAQISNVLMGPLDKSALRSCVSSGALGHVPEQEGAGATGNGGEAQLVEQLEGGVGDWRPGASWRIMGQQGIGDAATIL